MKIIFISDFFAEQVQGGGELSDKELISILLKQHKNVIKINSNLTTVSFIEENEDAFFIVSNFIGLSEECKYSLTDKKYVIYEHDHKYIKNRNPATFSGFLAPKEMIINLEFYKNARAVFCQSRMQLDIIKKNTNLTNLINLSGNLWSDETLEYIRKISRLDKKTEYGIMESSIDHKNTSEAVMYCRLKNISFVLIPNVEYKEFLLSLGTKKGLVFFPKTPETLSRIVVEARMMGLSVKTNNLIGAIGEEWFSLKGEELINFMKNHKYKIVQHIMEYSK